jgi:hypothetical protein
MVGSGAAGAGDVLAPDDALAGVVASDSAPAFGADVSLNPQPIPPGTPEGLEMDDAPSLDDASIIIVGGDESPIEDDVASIVAADAGGPAFGALGAFDADDGPMQVSMSEDDWDS